MPLRLIIAFALSLLVHGGLFLPNIARRPSATSPPPPLQAALRLPPKPEPTPEPEPVHDPLLKNTLDTEEKPPPKPEARPLPPPPKLPAKSAPVPATRKHDLSVAQRKLSELLFYPPEAVAHGIEGEVRLILKLGENGSVEDVLLAASSGHPILDNAAIRAAYAMGRLNGVTSRELILPVIFRLQ